GAGFHGYAYSGGIGLVMGEGNFGTCAGQGEGIAICGHPFRGGTGVSELRDLRPASPTRLIALLRDILREIFDESAYSRFLLRHRMSSCPPAYAAFLREQELVRRRRPKCC